MSGDKVVNHLAVTKWLTKTTAHPRKIEQKQQQQQQQKKNPVNFSVHF